MTCEARVDLVVVGLVELDQGGLDGGTPRGQRLSGALLEQPLGAEADAVAQPPELVRDDDQADVGHGA